MSSKRAEVRDAAVFWVPPNEELVKQGSVTVYHHAKLDMFCISLVVATAAFANTSREEAAECNK